MSKDPSSKCIISKYFLEDNKFVGPRRKTAITDPFLTQMMKSFISGQAMCLDYMVSTPIFQTAIPDLAMSAPMLLNAVAACGAYKLGRKLGKMELIEAAAEYYKVANSMLYVELTSKDKDLEVCLATALLITVYEMGFAITHDLPSHILGVKSLLQEFPAYYDTVTRELKFSSPIAQGAFWVLLHCDILAAFLLRSVPIWNPNEWGPLVGIGDTSYYDSKYPNKTGLASPRNGGHYGRESKHFWYRRAIHILYRISSLRGLGYDPVKPTQTRSHHTYVTARQVLFDELHDMVDQLPGYMQPLFEINKNDKSRNRGIGQDERIVNGLFSATSNTAGNINGNPSRHPSSDLCQPGPLLYPTARQTLDEQNCPTPDRQSFSSIASGLSRTDEWVQGALYGTHPSTLSQIFFADPVNAIMHAYIISAMLALQNLRPNDETLSPFSSGRVTDGVVQVAYRGIPLTVKAQPPVRKPGEIGAPEMARVKFGFDECRQQALRLVSIITSSTHKFEIGGMTAWGFLFAQLFITDPEERRYMVAYFDRLCSIGWSTDKIKAFLQQGWKS